MEWWEKTPDSFQGKVKRGFDSFVIATVWHLWKQRNARVFNRNDHVRSAPSLVQQIQEEIKLWKMAGVRVKGLARFVREYTYMPHRLASMSEICLLQPASR